MSVAVLAGKRPRAIELAQKIIGFLLQKEPTAVVVNRVIGGGAISHVDENYAISQQSSADVSQEGSIARSEELIQEMESSDFVVIGTPMHNFTVPSALKAWIDHVVRARRTFNVTRKEKLAGCAIVRSSSPCPRADDFPASVRVSRIF